MIELLIWLARAIILTLVIRIIMGAIFGRRVAGPRRQAPRRVERAGGALVRDPQCGTYLPASRAIRVGSGTQTLYFCSEACRAAYSAAHSSVA